MEKILIIDDSPPLLEELKEILTEEGYQVFIASDPYLGVDKAVQLKPDLIITDIIMPHLSGFEVISFIRSTSHLSKVPILILSSQHSKPEISRALMEADIFLKKPCAIDELIAAVNLLLYSASHKQLSKKSN